MQWSRVVLILRVENMPIYRCAQQNWESKFKSSRNAQNSDFCIKSFIIVSLRVIKGLCNICFSDITFSITVHHCQYLTFLKVNYLVETIVEGNANQNKTAITFFYSCQC